MSRVELRELAQNADKIAAGLKRAQRRAKRRGSSTEHLTIAFPTIPFTVDEPRMHLFAVGGGHAERAPGGRAVESLRTREDWTEPQVEEARAFNTLAINEKHLESSRLIMRIERQACRPHPTCEGFEGANRQIPAVLMSGA
jgi:hypothetical protein